MNLTPEREKAARRSLNHSVAHTSGIPRKTWARHVAALLNEVDKLRDTVATLRTIVNDQRAALIELTEKHDEVVCELECLRIKVIDAGIEW